MVCYKAGQQERNKHYLSKREIDMGPRSNKESFCLSASIVILASTLAAVTSGCKRTQETPQKAPVVQSAPAGQKAPVAPAAQSAPVAKKYFGKYLNKKYPKDFTELKSDGTFLYQEGKISLTGKYSIQGSRLLLALPDGSGSYSKIDERGITDNAGELWTKQ
jgi:hypothetical protein